MTSDYCVAVHALVYLNHKAKVLSSEELAENICTNPARVRKVMAKLKKAGLVTTRTGTDGGYQLTADPAQLTLDVVADALEAVICLTRTRTGSRWTRSRRRWKSGLWTQPGRAETRI